MAKERKIAFILLMKKLLLILLCLPMIGFGQLTMIPDDNFEQRLIQLGYDNILDDYVATANINSVTFLDVSGESITDLTGIEDFTALDTLYCYTNQLTSLNVNNNTALTNLECGYNQLTNLDVSNNTALTTLYCHSNQLTSLDLSGATALTYLLCATNQLTNLDVSQNTALTYLYCGNNQLTNLDVNQNTALTDLLCFNNQLTSLDVSQHTFLTQLHCSHNQLTTFDIRNGNNINVTNFISGYNPNLTCINVDDSTWCANNWTFANGNIDPQHYFSNNCSGTTDIEEHTTNKELLRTIDILGRETTNQPLFYIYDDGTVEKKIIID